MALDVNLLSEPGKGNDQEVRTCGQGLIEPMHIIQIGRQLAAKPPALNRRNAFWQPGVKEWLGIAIEENDRFWVFGSDLVYALLH